MPIGTTTPNAKFTFEFEALTVDGVKATSTNMPPIDDKYATFDGSEVNIGTDGVKVVYRETPDIFDGITWPNAGVYVYKVTEKLDTWTTPAGADYTDVMTYSFASYDIEVYVDNKADGSGYYIKYIAAILRIDDNGKELDEEFKVDPTPGDPDVIGDYSDMIFTNIYVKKTGGTDPTDEDDTVLEISKAVTGSMADHSKLFAFSVTVNSPEVGVADGEKYKAYVVETVNGIDTVVTNLEFTSGTAQTVNLSHGQRLTFLELPVGSSFAVTENAVSEYTASYSLILDGGKAVVGGNADDNTPLSITKKYIGENTNSAAFFNAFRTVTPTGIGVDDLPYIVLFSVALMALTVYLIIRANRKNENNA
jgi:hypothetical protein